MKEILILILLIFIFVGEPDVWDKLHDKAMKMENCK